MPKAARLVVFPAAVAALALGFGASSPASTKDDLPVLLANVGPAFQISLTRTDGTLVQNLAAGSYEVKVNDQASNHNFHLLGPGIDQKTEIGDVVESSWTVTFQAGNGYTYMCDAHSSLTATLNVTVDGLPAPGQPAPTPPTSTTPTTGPAPTPPSFPALQAWVSPKALVSLGAKTVAAGSYIVDITDQSRGAGLVLQQLTGGKATKELSSNIFLGEKQVTVKLTKGRWKFFSKSNPKRSGILTVA